MNSSILQRDHRVIRGTIAYTSNKPDRLGQERGREHFHISVHSDGRRTCSAHSEIDDRPSVMRDIVYSLDEHWLPTDCFVRLTVNDRFMGTGWFRFGPDFAECETHTALEGRVTQRMETKGRLQAFQNHAIVCDALAHAIVRQAQGSGPADHRRDAAVLTRPPWARQGRCCSASVSAWSTWGRRASR